MHLKFNGTHIEVSPTQRTFGNDLIQVFPWVLCAIFDWEVCFRLKNVQSNILQVELRFLAVEFVERRLGTTNKWDALRRDWGTELCSII